MPTRVEDDWSDSDMEDLDEVETSVLLGVPDGPISSSTELLDAAVSRIGGHPAFLTAPAPVESSQCKNCDFPMELLVQLWCPLEDSPMDRALYIWGCSRSTCQKKDGSIRAWRGLRLNEEYAKKLEKKKQKEKKGQLSNEPAKPAPKVNPFAKQSGNGAASLSTFGLGSHVFGSGSPSLAPDPSPAQEPEADLPTSSHDNDAASTDDNEDEENELVVAMASASLESSPWQAMPSYTPLYLSTMAEYLPPPPKQKLPAGVRMEDSIGDEGKPAGGWAPEIYENSMDLDQIFERFAKRVSAEGEQCIRYELGGIPLPFSSDKVFDRLFPAPKATVVVVGKDTLAQATPARRTFTTDSIPRCAICGADRVFECQLMPNLINVTRAAAAPEGKTLSDEERREEVRATLAGEGERAGMGWGTCMVFSCEKDCCGQDGADRESWTEEVVLIQWDD